MNSEALVTVFVPVYNAEKYIESCMDSVLAQTYKNWELLLIDDGSTDGSAEKIRAYSDRRIRFYQNDGNRGIPYTRNRGLELARGKYIAFLDADDVSHPRRLERSVRFLQRHLEYQVMGGMFDYIVDQAVKQGSRQLKAVVCRDYDCVFCSPLVNSTAMVDMDLVRKQNIRYNSSYFVAQDYDFFCQCLKYTSIARIRDKLTGYRTGHENVTARSKKEKADKRKNIIRQIRINALNYLNLELSEKDRLIFLSLSEEEKLLQGLEYRELAGILAKIGKTIPDIKRKEWNLTSQKMMTNLIIRGNASKKERIRHWSNLPLFRENSYQWIALARMFI